MLVVLVGLLCERLGQQHYDLLDTTSESSLCSCYIVHTMLRYSIILCIILGALGSAGVNMHSCLNVWACAKTLLWSSPPFQFSPVQSSDCLPPFIFVCEMFEFPSSE